MVRRSLRVGFRIGLLAGLVFALFKLVQSRRSSPVLLSGRELPLARRNAPALRTANETPLVHPEMLNAVGLKPSQPDVTEGDGQGETVTPAPGPAADASMPAPAEAAEAAVGPPPARVAEKGVAKKLAAKKMAVKKRAPAKKGATKTATAKKAAKVAKVVKVAKATRVVEATKAAATRARSWIDPQGSFCPSSHPVKGKLASGIYHLPGMAAYDRTRPDRCYANETAAQGDGLRKAKR